MDKLAQSERRVELLEDKLEGQKAEMRETARVLGRKQATKAMKKVDHVFTPRKLNPDDAKVIHHPID